LNPSHIYIWKLQQEELLDTAAAITEPALFLATAVVTAKLQPEELLN
jgi:hypothetical protein